MTASEKPTKFSSMKHVLLICAYIRQQIEFGRIALHKVSTQDNVSDILTKALSQPVFHRHLVHLLQVKHDHLHPFYLTVDEDSLYKRKKELS